MTRGGTATAPYTYTSNGVSCQTTYTWGTGTRQTRTFIYDNAGRLTSATNPESGTVNYNYNSDNTLQYKVDAKNQAMAYTYDSQKRVTMTQQFPSGMGGAEDTCRRVTYTWDTNALNPSFSSNATGRLTTAQYADCLSNYAVSPATLSTSYVEMYSYHPAGGVVAKRLQVNRVVAGGSASVNLDVGYTFDSAGRVVNTTVPYSSGGAGVNEPTITYYTGYDSMGRPSWLNDNDALNVANGYST
jgi:YD repeat-containing protein